MVQSNKKATSSLSVNSDHLHEYDNENRWENMEIPNYTRDTLKHKELKEVAIYL